jgi:dipeptidyl aminopeptidase/acylaminoacyl peptidase
MLLTVTKQMKKPALIIHGTEDQTVPISHGRQLAQNMEETSCLFPVEGGNHHLRNVDRKLVITKVLDWLSANSKY